MPSIRPNSGTWQRYRMWWRRRLLLEGPVACSKCGRPVDGRTRFDLDHVTAVALGGGDGKVWPAHPHCNQSAGARLGNRIRTDGMPSRDW